MSINKLKRPFPNLQLLEKERNILPGAGEARAEGQLLDRQLLQGGDARWTFEVGETPESSQAAEADPCVGAKAAH